ncbi:MAG: prolyl oligopeptidase family serine peptidase [Bacteriovorax sp.]|nr:prolyl oligopeptidase family serine peptidase [Bacteriovorax sp.]
MTRISIVLGLLLFILSSSCSSKKLVPESFKKAISESIKEEKDPFLWLEEIEGQKALAFVKNENEKTFSILKNDPHFKRIEVDVRKIAMARDRVPWAYQLGKSLYNFWQDEANIRGLWRRTSFKSYESRNPKWENVLDLDTLSKKENENWVWKGASCFPPKYERCLVSLSRGGKDATIVREFDLLRKSFVKDGFEIPEAKTNAVWADSNTLYVGTDFGSDSTTESGYPRILKSWKRGQKIRETVELFHVDKKDLSAGAYVEYTTKKNYHFLVRDISFFEKQVWFYNNDQMTLLPMPNDAQFYGVHKNYILYLLRSNLSVGNIVYKSGSVVALPLSKINDSHKALSFLEVIFTPTTKKFISNLSTTKNHILLDIIDNIQGKILKVTLKSPRHWEKENIPLGQNGVASIESAHNETDILLATYTDFLTSPSLVLGNASISQKALKVLKKAPSRFNEKEFISEQRFTKSHDGTIIPYFIVHKKSWKKNGLNPTLLTGYGGFEVSERPYYLNSVGKVWAEKGGVYVLANIRGGGEFGATWHQAAVKENRQKVFEDFIAIAEDLIKQKITSPTHLGIQGGSNGGLLVGGTFVQRPELFNAVLCEVPLLDMLRYNKLLAGASWMDEYGNPDDSKMREVIAKYSPYQNVLPNKSYPEVFFLTSTKDDRVHPGHARKMVAKMRSQGHLLFYYENTEGGHGGSANIEQRILWNSLEYTYLWRKLGN